MAEGWAKALKGDVFEAFSAGTAPHGLNPLAVRVMREVGVDISLHTSKHVDELTTPIDVVVTVCDDAHERCPVIPGAKVVHAGFDDPPRLARGASDDEQALVHYRRVRDEIRAFIETLPERLTRNSHKGDIVMNIKPKSSGSCCGGSGCCDNTSATSPTPTADEVREKVREGYASIARSGSWTIAKSEQQTSSACGCGPASGGCCGPTSFTGDQLAAAIGYSAQDLEHTPDDANMGLSCGNPTAIASLKPGEVVLDLGSGGGFDCFVAGPKVGASGRVIGVDMTPDMVSKARRNTAMYQERTGLDNVEFRLGEIESLPVADASVDVVISNCVLNLSPDKSRVWREIARVLKPGGRVAVSDLALLRPLPESVRSDVEALVGCVAGAVLVDETRQQASSAGLVDLSLRCKPEYIEAMTRWEDPLYRRIVEQLPAGTKPADFITSLDVTARKPR